MPVQDRKEDRTGKRVDIRATPRPIALLISLATRNAASPRVRPTMCPACVPRRTARTCKRMVNADHPNCWSEALSGAFAMLPKPAESDCESVGCGFESHPQSCKRPGATNSSCSVAAAMECVPRWSRDGFKIVVTKPVRDR